MYKLILTNFDETLIDKDGIIPLSTVVLFDELRRKNIKIVMVTDRCLKSVLDYNKDFTICDYLITSNGSYIYNVPSQKVIYKKNMGIRIVKKIIKNYFEKADIYITNHKLWNLLNKNHHYFEFDVKQITDIDSFLEENKTDIYKMDLCFKTLEDAQVCLKEIKKLDLKVNINLKNKDTYYDIEITNSEISKLGAVEKILTKEKLTWKDIIFFGTDKTDIPLLKQVGLGIAVANAVPLVKKAAQDITLDHNSKGVEQYLKKIF